MSLAETQLQSAQVHTQAQLPSKSWGVAPRLLVVHVAVKQVAHIGTTGSREKPLQKVILSLV
jgi:hypothetical protein